MQWLPRFRRSPAVDESRWLVLDVESSGLDASRDRLLAIAAIAVRVDWPGRRIAIDIADSFEVTLRQQQVSSRQNVLLHGIGAGRQSSGVLAAPAMRAFAAHARTSPLLAFHAAFDRTLVTRYARAELGEEPSNPWLDIEHLCGATHPQVAARTLDEWMAHFGVHCIARHEAAADALAECELLLRIWPKVAAECGSWRDVQRLAARRRWLVRA